MEDKSTRQTLIHRIKNQADDASWKEFTDWYYAYIMVILRRSGIPKESLEDNCQEILLKIWKNITRFDYDLNKCGFRTWLSTVCRNHILSYLTKNQRREVLKKENYDAEQNTEKDAEISEIIEAEWQIYVAEKAFEKVKVQFTENVLNVYFDYQKGVEPESIAEKMGIALNTVYVYNKRVKEAMTREILILSREYS